MKETRFIELLNLYVDHQIAPEEAAELEAEILRDPARRKTYRDYCRMQRACGMLFDRERQSAPAYFALEKSLKETERKIVGFPDRRKTGWGTYTAAFAGLTAMAACVALVLLRPGATPVATDVNLASAPAEKTSAPFVIQPSLTQAVAFVPRSNAVLQPTFASQNLLSSNDADDGLALDRTGVEWLQQVQLPPVQRVLVDNAVFETRPTLQQEDSREFRGSRPVQGNVEFTAFQFQR